MTPMNAPKRRWETKNPATPDQEDHIDKIVTIMAAFATSFSTGYTHSGQLFV
ncbi:MAG: hypothetical protein IIB68_06440 [Proteobacteria bacterium]|nr:hypothetical protein [Pseudomonadota bacterium]